MKSLFVISLPRSLSTQVYLTACAGLGLRSPGWTSAGEILNPDRSALQGGDQGLKFTTPRQVHVFVPAQAFLSEVVAPEGFGYKDVVQPFVVAQWLRDHSAIPVLKIVPNIAHVAFAMLERRWLYPTMVAAGGDCLEERMVSGLLRASRALDAVPGERVAYDDLVEGFEPVREALGRLYPDQAIGPLPVGLGFAADRQAVLDRREHPIFRRLQEAEAHLRGAAACEVSADDGDGAVRTGTHPTLDLTPLGATSIPN